ncbi:hypothetical protein IGS74_07655 [Aureimonas sp. OT7]|uniref:hypothetical protein n=1 Tax=Aureimonas TaxID=414371 RepID=UPI0017875BF8|nr:MULTISPECIES: hypothetical protein [Aureimonas]QOG08045.1 hypothetical protein IGS74_07655 [Aureimonas sp. OT7]
MAEEIRSTEAKQGVKGNRTLTILLVALALCLVVFAGLGIYGKILPDQNIDGPQSSGVETSAPPPAAGESQGGVVSPNQTSTPPAQ